MQKIDLKKEYKHLYLPSAKKVEIVDVPPFNFIMVDGRIEEGESPESSESFREAMTALYGLAFTLKFASKLRETNPIDFTVMALEGLWWSASGTFEIEKKGDWKWTMMIMQPDHVTLEMVQQAREEVRKKRGESAALSSARFDRFHEGLSIQIMHIGPYSEEPATIEKMSAFAEENGLTLRGKHHEIYIGDPRRAKPENLKTVLRHPVSKITNA
ncbi:MAG: GyrI-like domain-containing protein [Candidatus Promineifilaceae bacterium]